MRKSAAHGKLNDKEAKVEHIQTQIGRRPILAAGNTAGDQAMLEYALAGPQPGLAILIEHDDADREFAYAGSRRDNCRRRTDQGRRRSAGMAESERGQRLGPSVSLKVTG